MTTSDLNPIEEALLATRNPEPRNTFGICDPITEQRYPDIKTCHLELRRILFEEWYVNRAIRESADRKKLYHLLLDHRTAKNLIKHGMIDAMISFQVRTDGNYAVARLFDANRIKTRKDI